MKSGFSLSEVLITIVVVGTVSAITLSIVINKVNDFQFKNAYKKAYSDLSNVLQKAVSEDAIDLNSKNYYSSLKPYFKVLKSCENGNAYDCWKDADRVCTGSCNGNIPNRLSRIFIDSSGRAWVEYHQDYNILLVDTNGSKKPNRFGKDRWVFKFDFLNNYPVKVRPRDNDTTVKTNFCNYPPCYYHSWLYK